MGGWFDSSEAMRSHSWALPSEGVDLDPGCRGHCDLVFRSGSDAHAGTRQSIIREALGDSKATSLRKKRRLQQATFRSAVTQRFYPPLP